LIFLPEKYPAGAVNDVLKIANGIEPNSLFVVPILAQPFKYELDGLVQFLARSEAKNGHVFGLLGPIVAVVEKDRFLKSKGFSALGSLRFAMLELLDEFSSHGTTVKIVLHTHTMKKFRPSGAPDYYKPVGRLPTQPKLIRRQFLEAIRLLKLRVQIRFEWSSKAIKYRLRKRF
jgi:hypothetical protein